MSILKEKVKVKIGASNKPYYIALGYDISNIKIPFEYEVSSIDIPKNSKSSIRAKCDYCGKIFETKAWLYYTATEKKHCKKCACPKCSNEKRKETMKELYGTDCALRNGVFREKGKNTSLEKYGNESYMASDIGKEKTRNSLREKYNVTSPAQIPSSKEKYKKTCIEKYGVDNISKLPETKEKVKNTNFQRFGVEYLSQLPERREQAKKSFENIRSIPSSKAQEYICSLVGGKLNYPCHGFFLDVLFEDWLDIEYDGSGHDLNVQMGKMSRKDFIKKEKIRNNALQKYGYKQLVLINNNKSNYDKLPEDDILIEILNQAIFFLKNFEDKYISVNLSTLEIKTAQA